MKQLEDPQLKHLKNLLRYGPNDEETLTKDFPFSLVTPRSELYQILGLKNGEKPLESILCIIDDKSVRINTLYTNEVHKTEVEKWADRIGKTSFTYTADKLDEKALTSCHITSIPKWRLNKKPIKVEDLKVLTSNPNDPSNGSPVLQVMNFGSYRMYVHANGYVRREDTVRRAPVSSFEGFGLTGF